VGTFEEEIRSDRKSILTVFKAPVKVPGVRLAAGPDQDVAADQLVGYDRVKSACCKQPHKNDQF